MKLLNSFALFSDIGGSSNVESRFLTSSFARYHAEVDVSPSLSAFLVMTSEGKNISFLNHFMVWGELR